LQKAQEVTLSMLETKVSKQPESAKGNPPPLGEWNRRVGWVSMCVGVGTGLIMGLWSFYGPLEVPAWLGAYDQTPRRLARLGHIAFLGLGILNLLLAQTLHHLALGPGGRRAASWAMNFGNIFLPLTLFAAAAYAPLMYVMSVPALAVFVALLLTAYGVCRRKHAPDQRWPSDDATS
jgi:hypothetical protein